MNPGKTRLVVEVDKKLLSAFDKDIKKDGNTRTWKINRFIETYLAAKRSAEDINKGRTRKTFRVREKARAKAIN